jgi:hypothetical protein
MSKDLVGPLDLTTEEYREYSWFYTDEKGEKVQADYRIDKPVALYYRPGGSTHRVVDASGVTHTVPAPGYFGAALRWYAPAEPVSF